ncbi:MAG: GH3 auxin-responsive promoter family protein [Opitutaceae bacterium]|nr:GH3 auxin-responsive promoter family protein [Opitutaceae bacterium]
MRTAATVAQRPRTPWLQHAVALGAAVQTARVARRLRAVESAIAAQDRTRRALVARLAGTTFGRETGVLRGLTYAGWQARVAPRAYEDFVPWIERMKRGEADVLWPGRCAHYAVSSGTTAGRTKYLPVTRDMLAHFRRTGLDSLCYYARRTGGARVFRGRHLFLGGSTVLAPIEEARPFRAWGGDLSGIAALNLPGWVERHLYEPGRDIAQLADWPAKLRAIAARTAQRDITLVAGIPSWLLVLAEELAAQTGKPTLRAIWPRLECLVHGGVPLGPFASELRTAVGEGVNFHEVYPASEGFIAAQDDEPAAGLRLMADAGIFYEFLPLARFDETRLAELGRETVPLAGVETGVDYVLLMTTPAGLCRYVIGDVVRFISTSPARLVYAGRTRLQLSAFGEHVIEKELTDALTAVAVERGLTVANFHVAPRFIDTRSGEKRGRHEWWIELKSPMPRAADAAALAIALDGQLQRRNDDYEAKRKGGGLEAPTVRLAAPGTFERWLRERGKWGGQNKMPRCRSDRVIADELEWLHP